MDQEAVNKDSGSATIACTTNRGLEIADKEIPKKLRLVKFVLIL